MWMEYNIISLRKVDVPFAPGEPEILAFLNEVREASLETLDNLAKSIEGFSPINLPFILGFTEGFIRKTMMRTLLDVMQKKGLIIIHNDTVRITELGRIALRGAERREDLKRITSQFVMISEDTLILESGYYLGVVDKPFESDGIIIPECYMGIYNQFVSKGDTLIDFFIPIRTKFKIPCKIRLRKI
jgi:hypothetical protein